MAQAGTTGLSVVTYMGYNGGSDCGYCHTADTKKSRGMWAHTLTARDYQDLIDRNWRRSGKYCYQPMMKETCCPQYMIYCDALAFHPTRHQRKVIYRMNRFLANGKRCVSKVEGGARGDLDQQPDELDDAAAAQQTRQQRSSPAERADDHEPEELLCVSGECAASQHAPAAHLATLSALTEPSCLPHTLTMASVDNAEGCAGDAPVKVKGKKAKLLRKERRLRRAEDINRQGGVAKREDTSEQQQQQQQSLTRSLEAMLDEHRSLPTAAHTLETRLLSCSPRSSEFEHLLSEEYAVYKRYQMTVHGDPEARCTRKQFERFLVDSPLMHEANDGVSYGSFHYQYILDGCIVAVEVMDILPSSISSKYFFYDPQYSFLSLGTYSALCGIRLTRQLHSRNASLTRYLMGYYIHACQKMRYKAQFKPSYLLCPETYSWVPLEQCLPLLDTCGYAKLDTCNTPDDVESVPDEDVRMWHNGEVQCYKKVLHSAAKRAKVREYISLVGGHCAKRLLLSEPR